MNEATGARPSYSKQKNCSNCVQGKRRCDRKRPSCSRCIKNGTICAYKRIKPSTGSTDPQCVTTSTILMNADDTFPTDDPAYQLTFPLDLQAHTSVSGDLFMNGLELDGDASSADMPLLRNPNIAKWDFNAQSLDDVHDDPVFDPVFQDDHRIDFRKMASFCDNINPWRVYDPSSTLNYILKRIKAFPAEIARQNALPFMHRRLYEDDPPASMVSCFTVSVLYANRTAKNMPMVIKALQSAAQKLIQPVPLEGPIDSLDALARAQALLMYQVIRLFDGDIMLRAQTENDIPLFMQWLDHLCAIRDNLDIEVYQECEVDWHRWIFEESLRRTIIMSYSVIGLYSLIKGTESKDGIDAWSQPHRWTLSGHLWRARSSAEFNAAWKHQPRYTVTNYNCEEFLTQGSADSVDEFSELLLHAYMGSENANDFMNSSNS